MPEKFQRITELDFERIKTNFKRYLEGQSQFNDYDFSGSGLDVILDLYAYNTHYNAFYLNASINETYLATATKRKSVTSIIRPYGYVPRSKTGAQIYVNLEIEIPLNTLISIFGGTDYGIVQLQKNNRFNTKIDGTNYTFVNPNTISLSQKTDTTFEASNVLLRQGIPNTFRYTVNIDKDDQVFEIPSDSVDISTLKVSSQSPTSNTRESYSLFKDVAVQSASSNTRIYFLHENDKGRYEVTFGDGKYGYKPINNEVIYLDYLIVNNEPANGAQQFIGSNKIFISGNEINNATITVSSIGRSSGGTERESLNSIKYYAPKYYLTQDKAIVGSDYESILRQDFPNIEAVNTWGGEENNPPKYGRTIIAAKPFGALFFTDVEKDTIKDSIRKKMVTTIRPEIVDPKYTYLQPTITINYDSERTVKDDREIQREVSAIISDYARDNFNRFKYKFIRSDLQDVIDEVSGSFVSVQIDVLLKKLFVPTLNVAKSYTFYFQNPILYPFSGYYGSIYSSSFTYREFDNCILEQNDSGNLSIYTTVNNVKTTVASNIGDVDYDSGVIVLRAFQPETFEGSNLELYVVPKNNDIETKREFLLQLRDTDVSIQMVDVNDDVLVQSDSTTIDTTSNSY